MKNQYFLHACQIDEIGTNQLLDHQAACDCQPGRGFLWVHLHASEPGSREWLESNTELNPQIIDALLAKETRPRLLQHEQGMMVIFRAMNLFNSDEPEDMIALRMWIDQDRVITTRNRDIKAIEDIQHAIQAGEAIKSPADFLIMITSRLFARMEPFIEDLEEDISRVEEQIALGHGSDLMQGIGKIRKQTAIFRRYIIPQKAVVGGLLRSDFPCLTEEHKQQLAEDLDRVTRFTEELDELRDRTQIINEEVRNMHAERLNEITYIFSVAATIFLPLSFLTGLMGINVGGMPGVDSGNAFWIFAGITAAIAGLQIFIFRKFNWF